jgi:hypothetical protein
MACRTPLCVSTAVRRRECETRAGVLGNLNGQHAHNTPHTLDITSFTTNPSIHRPTPPTAAQIISSRQVSVGPAVTAHMIYDTTSALFRSFLAVSGGHASISK